MAEKERQDELAEWIASRPERVRALAAEFPPLECYEIGGRMFAVVGYIEPGSVIVSRVGAAGYLCGEPEYIHTECLRRHKPGGAK